MSFKILSIIFLTLSLFVGEPVPKTLDVNLIADDGTTTSQTLDYGDRYFYALADHYTEEGQTIYTKIASDEVLNGELSSSNYAIIIPAEDGKVFVEGYDDIKFEGKYLMDNGDDTYTSSNEYSMFLPNYLVFEFNPRYKLNSMSVTGVNMNAGDAVTDKATLEFDITGSDAIFGDVHKLQENCFYLDADKFDKFLEKYAKVDAENVDEFISDVITNDEKLVSGKRYYALVSGFYYEDFNCFIPYEGEELPTEKELARYIGKSSDFVITINGKKANRLNIDLMTSFQLDEYKLDVTTNAATPMARMITTLGKYYTEFVANEITKKTDLVYSVLEEYEWVISSATQEDVDGKIIDVLTDKNKDTGNVEVNVKVNEWALEKDNKLVITVDSLNGWNMVDQNNAGNKSGYTIKTAGDDTAWDETTPLITLDGIGKAEEYDKLNESESTPVYKVNGIFDWKDGTPKWAGTYKDTLTFTAEIKGKDMPKVGTTISFDAYGDSTLENFRVTRVIDGNTCELIERKALDNALALYNKELDPDTPGDADRIGKFDIDPGDPDEYKTYSKYFGSNVDNYLNNDYLNGLKSNVANAIKSVMVSQDLYTVSTETAKINEATLRDSLQSENRKIYVLGFSQLKDYLSSVSSLDARSSIRELYNLQPNSNTKVLISSVSDSVTYYGCNGTTVYDNSNGTFAFMYRYNSNPIAVYPTFQIDLSNIDFEIVDETTSR